ncbi:hypothetical protein GGR54DRAFT_202505 [Hypoxylon sp. NC1633]|nr:hypothetical protein GGR54DRAFT_202505 [Hypoxylon sp. NC1633]
MAKVLNDSKLSKNNTNDILSSTNDDIQFTRLHITPLDESLLPVVVPSSVLPRAQNISYHTIETFPDKRYGFVDLPTADADKIKKKLNGAILKGCKMRVEKAKPEYIPNPTAEADEAKAKKDKIKSKKRKREADADATPGIELQGRMIKRGWTISEREMIDEKRKKPTKDKKDKKDKRSKEDKEAKKKRRREVKSKYTDGPECLFKTKFPDAGSSTKTDDDGSRHHRKKTTDREVTIHEFEKTVKYPSFLKTNTDKLNSTSATFKDDVGWVDENGNIVEPLISKRPNVSASKPKSTASKSHEPAPVEDDDDTSSSDASSSDDPEDDEAISQESSDSDSEESEIKLPPKILRVETQTLRSPVSTAKPESARPKSSSSITSLTIKIPPVTPAAAKVHPLEALYKRPRGDAATVAGNAAEAQPFSFFNNEEDDDDDAGEGKTMGPPSQPPMTPFTKQDFDFRSTRSAAPTPDTAHPGRTFNLWPRQGSADRINEDDEGEEDEVNNDEEQGDQDKDIAMVSGSNQLNANDGDKQTPVSDFQKQFWESRGDLNRSWRKRRKAASKEKRYRENRSRAERSI